MSATSDNGVQVGVESTYNTPVAASRSFPVTADTWQLELSELTYDEMISGQVAGAASSLEWYERGGVGSIPKPVRTSGDGILWQAAVGTSSISGTNQTHQTDTSESSSSLTVKAVKSGFDGTAQVHTFSGAVITEWSLEHSPGDVLKSDFQFYWKGPLDTSTAANPDNYPTGKTFRWNELEIDLGGYILAATGFSLTVNNNLNVDQDFLATSQPRPCRTGKLQATGTIDVPINNDTKALVARALNNETETLGLTWTKSSSPNEVFSVSCPAVRVKPMLGEMALDDLTTVSLEFTVVDDDSPSPSPAITVGYDTKTDTAF